MFYNMHHTPGSHYKKFSKLLGVWHLNPIRHGPCNFGRRRPTNVFHDASLSFQPTLMKQTRKESSFRLLFRHPSFTSNFPWHRYQIEGTNGFYCLIRKTEIFTISNIESQVFTPNNSPPSPGIEPGQAAC